VNKSASSRMLMIVDDSEEYRSVLRAWLQMKGYQVIEACDGDEAYVSALEKNPDLILMDIGMPQRSGISATYRIRKESILRDIPIIAITGFTSDDLHRDALKAGCIECLTKPVDIGYLENLIERLLSGRP
jgi:two-component system cell cycle response regulator DivK